MKTIIHISFIIAVLAIANQIHAQPIKTYKLESMYQMADELMATGDYYNAAEWYKKLYKEEDTDDNALMVAYSYYQLRNYEQAERWYSRILDEDVDNIYVEDKLYYGKTLRALGELPKAKQELEKFVALTSSPQLKYDAQTELKGMAMAPRLEENKEVVLRFAGDVNNGSGEYSPVEYSDSLLYFTSFDRRNEIVLDGSERDYHAKLFRAPIQGGEIGKAEELDQTINRDGYHVAGATFTKDRRYLLFARQILDNDSIVSSMIYKSEMGDEDWKSPDPIGINGEDIMMQPAMGELFGQEVLFFVSNMEGGMGGYDIYYAPVRGNDFGAPVNLGAKINTPGNDIAPFYHKGKLYYSTDYFPGLGNLDIYASEWDGESWSAPQNLGHQYNTVFDDYGITFSDDGTRGYLVSNRPDENKKKLKSQTCCYDIYQFDIRQINIDLMVGVGEVIEGKEKPLKGATVELVDMTMDEMENQTLPEEYRFEFKLYPERRYAIVTSMDGYLTDTTFVSTADIREDKSMREKVMLTVAPPEEEQQTDIPEYTIETVTINQAIRLNNIYYDYDKWDILPASEEDLNLILELMQKYSDMVIELSSHTDSRGTMPYNKELSQKRAESARSWLLAKGVDADRIVAKGYGETKILNRCVNGVRCSDEEHRFNRRTEFKIIEGPTTIEIKREVKKESSKESMPTSIGSSLGDSFPIIKFEKAHQDLGKIKQGDKVPLVYEFTNVGTAALKIELATTCKCTAIEWPENPIQPGEKAMIEAIFDSAGMEGKYTKTIDIIANTKPIVVEAKFDVEVIK